MLGRGLGGSAAPAGPLDCGQFRHDHADAGRASLAAHPFATTLTGDASLSRRPMRRVIAPLDAHGRALRGRPTGRPPLAIHGGTLQAIDFQPDVPSAQVKSAVLLAGLHADGITTVTEPLADARSHGAGAAAFGVQVDVDGTSVSVSGGQRLPGARPPTCRAISRRRRSGWSPPPPCPGPDVTIESSA